MIALKSSQLLWAQQVNLYASLTSRWICPIYLYIDIPKAKERFFIMYTNGIILRHEHLPKRSIWDFFGNQTRRLKGKI